VPVVAPQPAHGQEAEAPPDSSWVDTAVRQRRHRRPRSPSDRVRKLLLLGLLGAALVALWLRMMASDPHLPLVLQTAGDGSVLLAASPDAALQPAIGRTLQALVLADGRRIAATAGLLWHSPRWVADDAERHDLLAQRVLLGQALLQPAVMAQFDGGLQLSLLPRPRGLAGLGPLAWALCILALALYLAAAVVVLAQPGPAALLYMVLAVAQSLNLLLIGASRLPGLGVPGGLEWLDLGWRLAADLVAAAALVHVLLLYPRRHPRAHALGLLAWMVAGACLAWLLLDMPAHLWWWAQGVVLAAGGVAALLLRRHHGQSGQPLARQLQRLVVAGTCTLLLFTLAMALAGNRGDVPYHLATFGSLAWMVFFASLLMLGPFLARSRRLLREFSLLAGVSTVAASLTLLFLAILGLQPVVALGLSLVVSLVVYLLARPWLLQQLAGSGQLSAERMFDSVYRAARALEQSPGQVAQQLGGLLREVFDPQELARSQRSASRVRVAADGSTLVVPVPHPPGQPAGALVLRYAQQGRRLFTLADVQLCERLLDQLRRAEAYDRAVEHGRAEERARIAQDLHDDIGARLLTLMYKAQDDEIEEYIRHTLQDLKTLTRGLAAGNQRLSHAAAEWKADITQRLQAAGCSLHWSFSADRDITLTAVQWSGLTRVLRELVNNVISHARASQVEISLHLDRGRLVLVVSDDGIGQQPQLWAHGLGLGGVRKRVKLLAGQVVWLVREQGGIRCEVTAVLAGPVAQPHAR
jgi:signal transduction histidine kinase